MLQGLEKGKPLELDVILASQRVERQPWGMATANHGPVASSADAAARAEAALKACSLEYATLRTEILNTNASRHQIPLIAIGAASLVAGFTPDSSRLPDWLVYSVSVFLVILGIVTWWHAGWDMGKLSTRIAQIEKIVTELMTEAYGPEAEEWLSWETSKQNREGLAWLFHGPGLSPLGREELKKIREVGAHGARQ
ncbi:hypothetical protein OHA70_33270 [Kribbella sp. NBC_00382]|uniref:hypothetical protein n=1 Tax=Kribbella sp. NBC_00382 TaxID=2975967 RepID=UPI002E1F55F3